MEHDVNEAKLFKHDVDKDKLLQDDVDKFLIQTQNHDASLY